MGSSPNFTYRQVPTAGQWNAAFAAKQDDLGYTPVNRSGDTMEGPLVTAPSTAGAANLIVSEGVAPTLPANGDLWMTTSGLYYKAGNNVVGPLNNGVTAWKQAANYATTGPLPACTYDNGILGVGATLTATADGALSIDGDAVTDGQRVLIKDQVAAADNGVYVVTQAGDAGNPWILTRADDYNQFTNAQAGDSLNVLAGTANANSFWVQVTTVAVMGTDPITLQAFALAYHAGVGIDISGSAISLDASAGDLTNGTIGSGAVALANSPAFVTPNIGAATGSGLSLSGLTASSAVATDGSKNLVSVTNTGTGNNVLASNPAIAVGGALTGLANLVSGAGILPSANGGEPVCATRTILAGIDATKNTVAYLAEGLRQGWFQWNDTNLATQVTSDPAQGIYVAPTGDPTGASGAWVRSFAGPVLGEWFGLVSNGGTTINDAAFLGLQTYINANSFINVQLPGGVFDVSSTPLNITGSDKAIFSGPYTCLIRAASTVTSTNRGALVKVGDGTTPTTRISVSGFFVSHLASSGLAEPAVVVNTATDVETSEIYTSGVAGLFLMTGTFSRITMRDFNGSYAAQHNVSPLSITPSGTSSELVVRDIDCLDGSGASSTAPIFNIAPTGGALLDTIRARDVECWATGGHPVGTLIDATDGDVVNLLEFDNICTDKTSSIGIQMKMDGSAVRRLQDIIIKNYRCDLNNGGISHSFIPTNSNSGSSINNVKIIDPVFPYQNNRTINVDMSGYAGQFADYKIENPSLQQYNVNSIANVIYMNANDWAIEGGSISSIVSGTTRPFFGLKTGSSSTRFVFSNMTLNQYPLAAVDFSSWTTVDQSRIITGNTGTGEPWAEGNPLLAQINGGAQNFGTAVTQLITYSIPSMLFQQGRRLFFDLWGSFGATGNTKSLYLSFGGTAITIFSVTSNGGTWQARGEVAISSSANVERYRVSALTNVSGTVTPFEGAGSMTESLASAVSFGVSAQGGATGDVLALCGELQWA